MNPTHQRGSLRTDVLVGIVSAIVAGAVLVPLSVSGWLATKLSVPVLIVIAAALGVGAGLLSSRRKRPTAGFTLKRPTAHQRCTERPKRITADDRGNGVPSVHVHARPRSAESPGRKGSV